MISMKKVCGACDSQFDLNKLSQIAQTAQPALADRPHDAQIAQTTVGARTCAADTGESLRPQPRGWRNHSHETFSVDATSSTDGPSTCCLWLMSCW